jgi:Fe-S-cluster-containing dehydrogenase component
LVRQGFQLDLNLCTGCQACVVACAIENQLPWDSSWRWVDSFNSEHVAGLAHHHLSLACNHCAEAPCARHCPALAYDRDPHTGAVLLDADKCIGCRYCTWACPYDAPSYDAGAGVVSKCTFCNERQHEGLAPACATQCPTGALTTAAMESLIGEAVVPGFPSTDAQPSIRFVPLRGEAPYPAQDSAVAHSVLPLQPSGIASKASLRSEMPLLIFSLLCALMVGIMTTMKGRAALPLPVFAGAVLIAAAASTMHLGRRERAWRAILNWKGSWLSREILLFTLFVSLGLLSQSMGLFLPWIGNVVALTGLMLLFAIDRVYGVTRMPGLSWHSASALWTGLLVAGVVAGEPMLWGFAALLKLVSYAGRKLSRQRRGRPVRPILTVTRCVVGILIPSVFLLLGEEGLRFAAYCTMAIGEIIDRAEFYVELEILTPARQIQAEFRKAAGLA